MTTATTNTVMDQTTDAAFRVWVAEVIAQLIAVGLTQTADTGQINTSTVTRASVNTSAGYAIFRFNDTAQSTAPIFIRIDFGSGPSVNTNPLMQLTVGSTTNGAGTIGGIVSGPRAITCGVGPSSTISAYTSRFCYNATAGVLWMGWKLNGNSGNGSNASLGGFVIYRSADSSAVVTTESFHFFANSSNNTGQSSTTGYVTTHNTALASVVGNSNNWAFIPLALAATLSGTQVQIFPVHQYTPVIGFTPWMGICFTSEIGVGATFTSALVGATTHTFISAGNIFGGSSIANLNYSNTNVSFVLLWE